MAQFVSDLSKTAKTVPQDYVYPKSFRPKMDAPIWKEIPVIDLSLAMSSDVHDRAKVVEKLLKALEDGWGFQVINHGVSEKLMDDAMEIYKELFNLPIGEKAKLVSDSTSPYRTELYSGGEDPTGKIYAWRDTLAHTCYPFEHCIDSWPEKPSLYRKVIAEYAFETKKVSQKIFELISEGLGLEKQDFEKFTEYQGLRTNYYPKCPDPSLTSGIFPHYDHSILSLLQQNSSGLQILKDENWLAVQPIPNAFFVFTAMDFQIISNDRFKALFHQVATNADVGRLSIGIFMSVCPDHTDIEPEKAFVSDENPRKYKVYSFENYSKLLKMKLWEGESSAVGASKFAFNSFYI